MFIIVSHLNASLEEGTANAAAQLLYMLAFALSICYVINGRPLSSIVVSQRIAIKANASFAFPKPTKSHRRRATSVGLSAAH